MFNFRNNNRTCFANFGLIVTLWRSRVGPAFCLSSLGRRLSMGEKAVGGGAVSAKSAKKKKKKAPVPGRLPSSKAQLRELKRSNAELKARAEEFDRAAKLLELKNRGIEAASRSLEGEIERLSLVSMRKSEFLAKMSHELRAPLNSLLILSKTLAENREKNLTGEQVKYASTVNAAGWDLLALVNEIFDFSTVEAGEMPVNPRLVRLKDVSGYFEQAFRPVAEHKGLEFHMRAVKGAPASLFTDENRLRQILKNLLWNAFKFTERGSIELEVSLAGRRRAYGADTLDKAGNVLQFSVSDTGIGVPVEKQKLIFEAFQQAAGAMSRKFGGAGLGLAISREIARLLGGVIDVRSGPGRGSTFTLYLPQEYSGPAAFGPGDGLGKAGT